MTDKLQALVAHDNAQKALIASQAAEVARLEALVVSRVRASADAVVEIASQAAEIAALKAENNTLRADAINAARLADQLIDMLRSGWIITNSILGASVLNEVLGHLRGDKS